MRFHCTLPPRFTITSLVRSPLHTTVTLAQCQIIFRNANNRNFSPVNTSPLRQLLLSPTGDSIIVMFDGVWP